MLPSDIYITLQWWFTLFVLGLGFLPLTFYLFNKFFDKGYIFSKVLALGITTYTIFVVSVLHLAPFTQITCYAVFAILAVLFFFTFSSKWNFWYILKTSWVTFAIEEGLFLIMLFTWAYIHSFAPDIHGLEKYMDFGFINSMLRESYLPPKDMWFTPFYINYYYFGHLMTAVLTRLSALPVNFTFNLMLSTIFALCFSQAFSLAANFYAFIKKSEIVSVIKRSLAGLLTACLVAFAGNLHILYAFFKPYPNDNPVPMWQLAFAPFTFPNGYWYPNATRFIHNTIHEFPMYSWVVADLHGHVLDIPFVLLMIALLFSIFVSHDPDDKTVEEESGIGWLAVANRKTTEIFAPFLVHPLLLFFIGFLLAIMYMTNAWDGAIYFLLAAGVIFTLYYQRLSFYKKEQEPLTVVKNAKKSPTFFPRVNPTWLRDLAVSILFIVAGFSLTTLPYNIFFKPFASGIGILCSSESLVKLHKLGPFLFEANHCQHSLWWQLLTLYGFFLFFIIAFFIFIAKKKKLLHVDKFILLLIMLGIALIIIPEFIYLKDIYPAHYRANTMFKLVFQSFIILSLVSGYVYVRIATSVQKRTLRFLFLLPASLLIFAVMLYPNQATKSYYGDFKVYTSLDGTAYLKKLYPTDADAIAWLNKHVTGQPVILEAQGDSYTDFGRVSTNTGLPTILGWTVHEWLWRGDYGIPAPRIDEIKTLYETTDIQKTKELLKKYNVSYVFIGTLEFQKYPQLDENKFDQLGKVVFQEGTTKIYKIN